MLKDAVRLDSVQRRRLRNIFDSPFTTEMSTAKIENTKSVDFLSYMIKSNNKQFPFGNCFTKLSFTVTFSSREA